MLKSPRKAGAKVAVASPNAPAGSANLTPFALDGSEDGLLYSPTTRTEALVAGIDVAPAIITRLGAEPPREMQGRPANVRSGEAASAERLGERLSFVGEKRGEVWVSIGMISVLGALFATLWKGRTGASFVLLTLAALPAGSLISAILPIANTPAITASTLLFGGLLVAVYWRFSSSAPGVVAGVYLTTAALILADTVSGGALMKLSTLGYNPAYGTRFYGIGNEYAAFLAGSLTTGVGALAYRRRLPPALVLAAGLAAVVVLGLPTMGADVGGVSRAGVRFRGDFWTSPRERAPRPGALDGRRPAPGGRSVSDQRVVLPWRLARFAGGGRRDGTGRDSGAKTAFEPGSPPEPGFSAGLLGGSVLGFPGLAPHARYGTRRRFARGNDHRAGLRHTQRLRNTGRHLRARLPDGGRQHLPIVWSRKIQQSSVSQIMVKTETD